MLPDREGRFKATIAEHGVSETGPNCLATFICKFALGEELVSGEWMSLDPDQSDFDITGYFYLEKKDGSINTITVDQLKAAFGWDGRDPMWLQDADFGGLTVQVKLEYELFDGKQRLKVRYVDAENASPAGVPKADDSTRRTLSTRLGSKLRALAGGTPAPAPKPSGKPTAPLPKPATKPPTKPATAPGATMQQAWEVFSKECPPGWGNADVEKEWFRILGELFPGKQPDAFIPAEWATVLAEAPAKIIPI